MTSLAKKDLQNYLEAKEANIFFKGLEPTCCPHCQISVSRDRRRRELEQNLCQLCGENISFSEENDEKEEELKHLQKSVDKAYLESKNELVLKSKEIHDCESQIYDLNIECQELENQISNFEERNKLLTKIAGLEFLLGREQETPIYTEDDNDNLKRENKIIKKAIEETKQRIESLQQNLLKEVSEKIKEYATRFGMTSISSVKLTSTPHLKLNKDGVEINYSKCTDGEKLRLKIAAIIALISIAEQKGIGRHPGLLLIDSPKREEITEKDIKNLVGGLAFLTNELPHMQIILAATSSPSILSYLDEEHRKLAQDDDFLF